MRTQCSTKGNRDASPSYSTDIFGISGGFEHPNPPLGTPLLLRMSSVLLETC